MVVLLLVLQQPQLVVDIRMKLLMIEWNQLHSKVKGMNKGNSGVHHVNSHLKGLEGSVELNERQTTEPPRPLGSCEPTRLALS
jgi:hypothetical protein